MLLPTMVGYDGFITSFTPEPLEIPDQEKIDEFLPPYRFKHIDPFGKESISVTTNYSASLYTEMLKKNFGKKGRLHLV